MSLDVDDPRIARALASFSPYARDILRRAGLHALRLHADVVTPEHVLSTLMDDPECAAHAAVLHAFADPPTISGEALAISPGLMVVASESTLPFSPRAVRALLRAREVAFRAGAIEVDESRLLLESAAELEDPARRALATAGLRLDALGALEAQPDRSTGASPPPGEGLFRRFSTGAKRALSTANRVAAGLDLRAIAPAHVVLGCLKEKEALAQAVGLGFQRARLALAGTTEDASEPAPRRLPPDPTLIGFLSGVRAGADSLGLLAGFLAGSTPELAQILIRQKATVAFLERARGAFRDPDAPS